MIEREAKALDPQQRLAVRQEHSAPVWRQLHLWMQLERSRVPDGSATA